MSWILICAWQSSATLFLHRKWSSDPLREGDFLVAVDDIIAEMKGITYNQHVGIVSSTFQKDVCEPRGSSWVIFEVCAGLVDISVYLLCKLGPGGDLY